LIVRHPDEFRAQIAAGWLNNDSPPVPRAAFLVEPTDFRLSEQSARDNVYMDLSVAVDPVRALDQHRRLTERISRAGIPVVRFPGHSDTPDDLFPNNAFATIPGRCIVGRMRHPERQLETRRADIRQFFSDLLQYETIDLSDRDLIAELTGALVIDRSHRIGYCGMSQRVDQAGCQAMHEAFDLALTFQFDLRPSEYHTNVVMAVLASRVLVLCPDGFVDPAVPEAIAEAYPGHVLRIEESEKQAFGANCIALNFKDLFMSQTAVTALAEEKLEQLRQWQFVIHAVELDEIEKAGGSLRCCVAEIF